MALPKTINRIKIIDDNAIAILENYTGKYDTQEFMGKFLKKTKNGKSTVYLANDFGLKIDKLTVVHGEFFYNVSAHVSPKPQSNDELSEMD